jgi:hypothetical protein
MRFSVSNRSSRRELNAAIAIQNEANTAAKVESRIPRWKMREESHKVRRELKHDAHMTSARRSYVEKVRQLMLTASRRQYELRKRFDAIRQGLSDKETKTELGIVLPSGQQVHKVMRDRSV